MLLLDMPLPSSFWLGNPIEGVAKTRSGFEKKSLIDRWGLGNQLSIEFTEDRLPKPSLSRVSYSW